MSSDERLVQRAAQGDKRALEEIYERYHQDLYRFCLAMVGRPHDAHDALQNTMVKVLRSLPGEKRQIKLKPWLYRIARNEAIETLRKRRDGVELDASLASLAAVSDTAETRERLRTLLGDLELLPERQRAVLVMRELAGLDFEQIGAAFGSSAAVARQTLYEARLGLRRLEAGREMRCEQVMRELSDADGRTTRRREIRAHLRDCAECRAFRQQIGARHEDFAALAPLPVAASAGLIRAVLGGKVGGSTGAGGGIAATAGGGAGKAVATSAIVKSTATVAIAVVAGVSAERSGLIDLPLPGKDNPTVRSSPRLRPAKTGAPTTVSPGSPGDARQPERALTDAKSAGGRNQGSGQDGGATRGDPSVDEGAASGGDPSGSGAGLSPPGGGYGRSAATRHGRPDSLPTASAKGQQAATGHKSSHAVAAPEKGSAGGGHEGHSNAPESPPAKHPPSSEGQAPTPDPPSTPPPSEAPGHPDRSQGESMRDETPPGFER